MISTNVFASYASLSVSPLSSKTIQDKGTIIFTLRYTNDINKITLDKKDIELIGFKGDVSINNAGNSRVVTISNIKSNKPLTYKKIHIKPGSAISSDGIKSNGITTESFTIK